MNKKSLNIVLLVLGAIMIVFSIIYLKDDSVKTLGGACLGIGAGLMGLATANLIMLSWYKKHPKEMKQSEIDYQDERNEMIRNKAKAKCSDIIQWSIMAVAWITIFADFPLWITLTLIGVFILKSILELYLMNKYNNEM